MKPGYSVLTRRADFVAAAASGFKFVKPSLVAQSRRRANNEPDADAIRIGFTATKTLGNAVARNRAKRRLRAAARLTLNEHGRAGCDYVFIARAPARRGDFDDLIADMKHALKRLSAMMAPDISEPES